jgi:LysM repeat protein
MLSNKSLRWAIAIVFALLLLATPKTARAWGGCGSSYVVQSGDTLSSIAQQCGVDIDALQKANNIGSWVYAGQTLYMPGDYQDGLQGGYYDGGYQGVYFDGFQGGANCYDYQAGSNCYSFQNWNNCYGYQGANCWQSDWNGCYGFQDARNCYGDGGCYGSRYVGTSGRTYLVQQGDTMRIIADRLGINICDLIQANPQVRNPSLIYAGQVLCLPAYNAQPTYYQPGHPRGYEPWGTKYGQPDHGYVANLYTVQAGEKLKDIAKKFDTTVEDLLDLNPALKDKPGNIYRGLVLRLW